MRSNRVLSTVGAVFLAALAIGASAQASPLVGVSLSTDGSLSMAETLGTSAEGASSFTVTDLSFDACSVDECSEAEEAALVAWGSGFGTTGISHASPVAPEPATFVLVGLTLAVLPLLRKRRR